MLKKIDQIVYMYNYMQYYGFGTMDGVHYTYNTYVDIFNHTVTSIMGDGT